MILAIIWRNQAMQKHTVRLIQTQSRVKVAAPAYRAAAPENAFLFTLAFGFAGVFYFFGVWLGRALTGG
jgi:hypothetical protein